MFALSCSRCLLVQLLAASHAAGDLRPQMQRLRRFQQLLLGPPGLPIRTSKHRKNGTNTSLR